MGLESVGTPGLWLGFIVAVLAMLALDLGVFHRRPHAVGLREAAIWSAIWVVLAVGFGGLVHTWFGPERAMEFAAGYLIEKALAIDNIFVFVIIFTTFGIPALYQHRVLFWGVLGALVMRAVFIVAGGVLLQQVHWMVYVFGAILAVTGIKLLVQRNEPIRPERNPLIRLMCRFIPVSTELEGDRFTVVRQGRRVATPLLLALVAVEITDVIFAIDSIPAIFAVTMDPFIVFTSNIFAILGLRSMYFLLAGVVDRFVYLKVGLSAVLVFVGVKMLLIDVYPIPVGVSLGVIIALLGTAAVASWLRPVEPPAAGDTAS